MHGDINKNSFGFESDNMFSCSELLRGETGIEGRNWIETRRLDCMKPDSEISSKQLIWCGRGTCHGFHCHNYVEIGTLLKLGLQRKS